MPYYITKEIIDDEVINLFQTIEINNNLNDVFKSDLQNFTFNIFYDSEFIDALKKGSIKKEIVEKFSDMLFQLKDYKYYLKVVLSLFMKGEKYTEIAYLINRTFINHIGDSYYVSLNNNYDYSERYFDRLVEACKYAEVPILDLIKYVLHINNVPATDLCYKYIRPSKEYLKNYMSKNEKEYFDFIEENEERYAIGLKLFIEMFTDKGLNIVLDKYVVNEIPYENVVNELVKEYKHTALPTIEKILTNYPNTQKLKVLELLKQFKNDIQIHNFIENFSKKIDDEEIKNELTQCFLNNGNMEIKSVEEFKRYIQRKNIGIIDTNLPSKYPLRFNNGEFLDELSMSYIFGTLKNLDKSYKLKELDYLKQFIDVSNLEQVASKLYNEYFIDTEINSENVWVVAFIVLFGGEYTNNLVINLIKNNFVSSDVLLMVLGFYAEYNNETVLKIVKNLYKDCHEDCEEFVNILKIFARLNNVTFEDYIDNMIDNYELDENCKRDIYYNGNYLVLSVTDNLNVELIEYNSKNPYFISKDMVTNEENYYEYILNLKKEIMRQIQRFKDSYYQFRLWDSVNFDQNILQNPLLKKIATTLTWGYYKGVKLMGVFKIIENKIHVLTKNFNVDSSYKIALVHPVELEQNKEIISATNFEPFNQLKRNIFYVNQNEYTLSKVSTFSGMLANYNHCVNYLKFQDWKEGLQVGGVLKSLVKTYIFDNLLCEVSFEKFDKDNITINDVRFYNLSNTTSQGSYYIINKNDSLLLNLIPKRTYSNILYEISQSCYY